MSVLKPTKLFVRMGFRYAAEPLNMSAFNLALSLNKKDALKGQYPNLEIDWDKLQLSQGDLAGTDNLTAEWTDAGLRVTWANNIGNHPGNPTDSLSLALYLPERDAWQGFFNEANRKDNESVLADPTDWLFKEVHVFALFVSHTGDMISDSSHVHVQAKT